MKVLHNKLIYDTEKLELLFNLDENKPKNYELWTKNSNNLTVTTTGATWTTTGWVQSPTHEKDERFTYTNHIAQTPNNRFVIVCIKSVKNDRDEKVELGRTITRFFKDKNDIFDYLSERYGLDPLYDIKLEEFFLKIGIKLENA